MTSKKPNKIEAALVKLRDNLSGDHIKQLQEERKMSGTMKELIDDTLKAIVVEDGLSEESVEAVSVLLALSYLEGYSQNELVTPTVPKVEGTDDIGKKIKRRIRRKTDG